MKYLVRGKDYIFHLAGQNDHVLSLTNPFPDIDINIKGSAILLEACKRFNKGARLIYSGTRGEYGPAVMLPVGEDQPVHPKGIYELSSLTAQQLFQIYNDNIAGTGRWEFAPFTPERAAQEPGDFCSDIRKIRRIVGWRPTTRLEDGVSKTVHYYRQHKEHYW